MDRQLPVGDLKIEVSLIRNILEISKMKMSLMGGCSPSLLLGCYTQMPNISCLLWDVGVTDVKR